jgi:hypothetical protein
MPCSRCTSGAPVLAHERGRKPRASCRSSARAPRARPRTPARTPRSARPRARFRRRTRPRARQPGGTGASVLDSANVASKKCWVRVISGRHSSDREPPAITPLGPTDSPARRVNMVESARRRYTTNRYLTASAGRWTMTRSWTFVRREFVSLGAPPPYWPGSGCYWSPPMRDRRPCPPSRRGRRSAGRFRWARKWWRPRCGPEIPDRPRRGPGCAALAPRARARRSRER